MNMPHENNPKTVADKIAYTVLTIVIMLFALYPVAGIMGWQYSLDLGFTLWRSE